MSKPTLYFGKSHLMPALFFVLFQCACSGNEAKDGTASEGTKSPKTAETRSSRPADACSLLTEEEAKNALGGPVTKGMSTESMCQYLSASDELSKAGESVSIQVNYGAASEFDNYVAATEKDLNLKTRAIPGIGDKAVFAEGQLIVSKGQNFMTVIVGKRMSEEEQIAAEKAIAQKAIERLAAQ